MTKGKKYLNSPVLHGADKEQQDTGLLNPIVGGDSLFMSLPVRTMGHQMKPVEARFKMEKPFERTLWVLKTYLGSGENKTCSR